VILILALLAISSTILLRLNTVFGAFLLFVATKSIVDAAWDFKVGPLSMLAFQGALVPFLFGFTLRDKIIPKQWKSLGWTLFAALSTGLVLGIVSTPVGGAENLIKSVNILIGFTLIPVLVQDKKDLKKLLLALMVSGIFPIAISIYQKQTGVVWQVRQTVGLSRLVGFYHDSFPVRFYGLLSIFSSLCYLFFFSRNNVISRILPVLLIFGALYAIYNVFSKAAVGILASWAFTLAFFSNRRFSAILILLIIGVAAPFIIGEDINATTEQLFSKEIGYQTGEVQDARFALAGRGYIWEYFWGQWLNEFNILFKLVGYGISRPTHNELLRILLLSGVIGVLLYLRFLFRAGRIALFNNSPFKPFILMLFFMYLIDSIGLVPGEYYYYNQIVWGFIGLFYLKPWILDY
jgi:hypothetical protein